ncbi:MAG: hypothetical protein Q7U51_15565, partial [Methanoregula sp.]|nr:hypothetical protein [Methanoregula sp.]
GRNRVPRPAAGMTAFVISLTSTPPHRLPPHSVLFQPVLKNRYMTSEKPDEQERYTKKYLNQ